MGRDLNKKLFTFAIGALIGSVATWMYLKPKYEKQLKEDIDSVKESFGRLYGNDDQDTEDSTNKDNIVKTDAIYKPSPEDLKTLKKTISENGYKDYTHKKEEENEDMNEPYVISPEEYDELGYYTQSLIYWRDKVVTDDDGNIVDDYEDHIGSDALNHFGEYEDDSVFVRNDLEQVDYEILLDMRRYSDVYGTY